MKNEKFILFLESLVTEDNKAIIEAVKNGFNALEESLFNAPDSMMSEESVSYKSNPRENILQRIQLMSNMADRSNHDTILDLIDELFRAFKGKDSQGFHDYLIEIILESKRDNARNIYMIAKGLERTLKL